MTEYDKRQQWFLDRIGKRVFRNESSCMCEVCRSVYEKGLIVEDRLHALYLADCEASYPFQYFDTKAEVEEFESNIRKKPRR